MSKPVLYSSPEAARLAAAAALSADQSVAASTRVDSADLPGQDEDAEARARENVQSAFDEVMREWDESRNSSAA